MNEGLAQADALPVFHYSAITGTFDGWLPIGQPFQIRGTAATGIDAVKVESFGYRGLPPPAFRSAEPGTADFCAALSGARADAQRTVVYSEYAWDRAAPGDAEFRVGHPRLYFGRNYVFVFTYYRKADEAMVRGLLAAGFSRLISISADFRTLLTEGRTGERIRADAERVVQEIRTSERACGPVLVPRGSGDIEKFWRRVTTSLGVIIAQLATRREHERTLQGADAARVQLKTALERLPKDVRERQGLKDAIATAAAAADSNDWIRSGRALSSLVATIVELQSRNEIPAADARATTDVVGTLIGVFQLQGAQEGLRALPEATPQAFADRIAAEFQPNEYDEFMSAATVLPYFQTMKASLPSLISLDGGLGYVERFRELIPLVGANVKLNRVDFDDPLDRHGEVSLLVGMGLSSPDDLDPDYEGIFGGSNRSLWLGLGFRPGFAPLLRAHAGVLLYRQHDDNPLQKDFHTKASLTIGLSANWDALDFTAKLIKGRPTLGAGGL